ncbi:MAG: formyltransferase family protein [Candidatus Hodarchaeales archaeon]|jgi:methionyl-tRNA formyltransferase
MQKIIFLVSKQSIWTNYLFQNLKHKQINVKLYTDEKYIDDLSIFKPEWVFFFHWSKIVKKKVYSQSRCVVLHTSDLPKFRGGSPLQNQIFNKIHSSRVNAIEMQESVDSGGIYASSPISLHGSLQDIWIQIAKVSSELILECITKNPTPMPQIGEPTFYKRLSGSGLEEQLQNSDNIIDVYDQIRALDADSYQNASIKIGNYMLSFNRAKVISQDELLCDVIISQHRDKA